ncbi:hypothetical protein RN51_01811 [Microbacterium oxydans]|uniref:Uncharacterized protein n=1 Tax=Microbacterium oxydans TaxID=82380 RepID=A0A0F0KNL0_9MICO|nr:hypothetical protein [Microbacterium oxydans]KJL22497.1 hypothetical protein RN51_01811 [Microbacterium oxydans]
MIIGSGAGTGAGTEEVEAVTGCAAAQDAQHYLAALDEPAPIVVDAPAGEALV